MLLTDYEWLRFVSFALIVGAIMGALYEAALLSAGRGPLGALVGAIVGAGALALVLHLVLRWLLGRATEPSGDSSQTGSGADSTEADA